MTILKESSYAYSYILLQKLNYVQRFQHSAGNQLFTIIHIICEHFRPIPWILCKIQLLLFESVKIESLKSRKSRLTYSGKSGFHWGNFNYFVMMSNETRQLQMYKNNDGSCFRLNVDPGIQLLSMDQCLAWPTVVQMMVFFSRLSVS